MSPDDHLRRMLSSLTDDIETAIRLLQEDQQASAVVVLRSTADAAREVANDDQGPQ